MINKSYIDKRIVSEDLGQLSTLADTRTYIFNI